MAKSELQKLIDGEWYKVNDPEVASRKINSAVLCQEFNNIPENEPAKQEAKDSEIFGTTGKNLVDHSRQNDEDVKNIDVGENLLE